MCPDTINACFQGSASLVILLSVRRVFRDKEVKRVSIIGAAFFTLWGFWNLYFYHAIGQTYSWLAAGLVAACNITWLVGLCKYRSRQSR